MEISPENIAQIQHQEWLHNPTTIQMLKVLDLQRNTFIEKAAKQSGNKEVDDAAIRRIMYGVSTIDVIKEWISNTNLFVEKQKQAN
jgi:predicted nucleic-acid-binding Zn-ribbon protein